jgi:hypothetical protein
MTSVLGATEYMMWASPPWDRVTIQVAIALHEQKSVRAFINHNIPGLAITDAQGGAKSIGQWVITHVSSGRCIPFVFTTLADATRVMQYIGPMAVWTQSSVELFTQEVLRKRVTDQCLSAHGVAIPATV